MAAEDKATTTRKLPIAFYDKLRYVSRSNKSARFKRLKAQPIRDLFANRPSHEYVRKVAIDRWYKTFNDQLKFLTQLSHCEEYDLSQVEKISHDVFNWSYDDFLQRRYLENCIWIEVVLRNSTEKCLEKQKIKVDLKELCKFVDMLYEAICAEAQGCRVDLQQKIWQPLRDAERYSFIQDALEMERTELQAEVQELHDRFIIIDVIECMKNQHKQVLAVENVVTNADVWDPIEVRYELNWYRSITNQNQYQADIKHFQYTREIEQLKNKITNEKTCSGSVLNTYYSDAEQYKRRTSELQERFDMEFDELDNNSTYTLGQMEKLQATKKFLLKEIQRFHFEIEARLAKEEKLRSEEEEKRLALEAAALARLEEAKRKEKAKEKKSKATNNNKKK